MASAAGEPAFLSHPSEVELIQRHLLPRFDSGNHACTWIRDVDIYADDPDVLTARYAAATAGDGECAWYFFSPLRTKEGFKDRRQRAVPSGLGSWCSERAAKPVLATVDGAREVVVGMKQRFAFTEKNAEGHPVRSGWLMLELRLVGDVDKESLTLCKIYPTTREKPAAKAKTAASVPLRTLTILSAAPPPEHRASSSSEEAGPTAPPPPLDEGASGAYAATPPSPRGISGTHAEDRTSSARSSEDAPGAGPPTARGTATPAVPSAPSPRAEGTKEWVLLEIGVRDPEPCYQDSISVNRVFRMGHLEDPSAAHLARLKRKAFEDCSGLLVLAAKKPALCHGCYSV